MRAWVKNGLVLGSTVGMIASAVTDNMRWMVGALAVMCVAVVLQWFDTKAAMNR